MQKYFVCNGKVAVLLSRIGIWDGDRFDVTIVKHKLGLGPPKVFDSEAEFGDPNWTDDSDVEFEIKYLRVDWVEVGRPFMIQHEHIVYPSTPMCVQDPGIPLTPEEQAVAQRHMNSPETCWECGSC